MANRIFVSAVVILWLCSMTWLFTDRILPTFQGGQPPSLETFENGRAIAWEVEWGGEKVGSAASVRVPGAGGSVELHNRISLENMPIIDLAPAWMRMAVPSLGDMAFDVISRIEFDSLGNFSSFNSRVVLNDMPSVLKLSGRVKDSYLRLNVVSGQLPYEVVVYLPDSKSLNEALFPGGELPYMYVGRQWQEEVYSPFRATGDPIELVHAEVVSEESMEYCGESRRVLRVEYHGMIGSGISDKARLQAVSWVEPTGMVLRRDVYLGTSKLRFNRLSDVTAAKIGEELFAEVLDLEHVELAGNAKVETIHVPSLRQALDLRSLTTPAQTP
jgi:hypothetical protein